MGWAHHILSIETFIDENEPLMWRHSGSNLTGPLMVTPLLRFLSRHCWGPPSDNKTLQFRDSSCKLWIREKGLIFLISRQTLSLSPAPPGDKISDHWARRDERDHRQRRDKVSRVTDFFANISPAARSNTELHIFVTDETIWSTQVCFVRVKFRGWMIRK